MPTTTPTPIQLATQESVNAQVREMARQLKAYIDGHTSGVPIISEPVQVDLFRIYQTTLSQDLMDWADDTTETLAQGNIFCDMKNVRRFIFTVLRSVTTGTEGTMNFLRACPYMDYVSLPALTTLTGSTYNYAFNNLPVLQSLSLPSLTTLTGSTYNYAFQNLPVLQSLSLPSLTTLTAISNYAFQSNASLESVSLPMLSAVGTSNVGNYRLFASCPNLIDITIGHVSGDLNVGSVTDNNFTQRVLRGWSPTNVLADTTKKATMNANIRNHIAANFYDYSGASGTHTVTFAAAVYNALEAETLAAFTDKGWTVTSA